MKAISLVDIACSRRSDGGLWCEVREGKKNKKEEMERGGTHPLPHPSPSLFFFSAHISLHRPHDSNIPPTPHPPAGALLFSKNWGLSIGLFFGPAASGLYIIN